MWAQVPAGDGIVEITNDEFYDVGPSINDCGQFVFTKRIGWSWSSADIFLYDNGELIRFTDNDDKDVGADINYAGTIVWYRGVGDAGPTEIMLHADGETRVLASDRPAWRACWPGCLDPAAAVKKRVVVPHSSSFFSFFAHSSRQPQHT